MLNLQGKDLEDFDRALELISRSDTGKVFLSGLERDLKRLDALNRNTSNQVPQMGAAHYLGLLLEKAQGAGYKSTYTYAPTSSTEPVHPVLGLWTRIFSAFKGTVR